MAWAVMLSASVFADVYYNNKTFTESESTEGNVYIGHTNAEDGGTASDALVTVKNGATWNIDGTGECPIYIGNVSGVGRLVVEEGGQVKVVGDNKQYMIVGANNGADGVVTNKGNMVLRQLIMSVSDDSETYDNGTGTEFRKALFENFGSVVVSRNFHLGMWKGVNPSAVFYNHKGAKLEVQKADQYAFYIGGRSPACMTNAGEVVCAENGTLYIGRGIQSNGSGRLVLTENSTFKTSKNITIGGSAQGILEMSGSSTFGRSDATLKLGNSTKVKAAIEMSDNAKITVSSLNICNAQYVDAKIVVILLQSVIFATTRQVIGYGSGDTLEQALFVAQGDAVLNSGAKTTVDIEAGDEKLLGDKGIASNVVFLSEYKILEKGESFDGVYARIQATVCDVKDRVFENGKVLTGSGKGISVKAATAAAIGDAIMSMGTQVRAVGIYEKEELVKDDTEFTGWAYVTDIEEIDKSEEGGNYTAKVKIKVFANKGASGVNANGEKKVSGRGQGINEAVAVARLQAVLGKTASYVARRT